MSGCQPIEILLSPSGIGKNCTISLSDFAPRIGGFGIGFAALCCLSQAAPCRLRLACFAKIVSGFIQASTAFQQFSSRTEVTCRLCPLVWLSVG